MVSIYSGLFLFLAHFLIQRYTVLRLMQVGFGSQQNIKLHRVGYMVPPGGILPHELSTEESTYYNYNGHCCPKTYALISDPQEKMSALVSRSVCFKHYGSSFREQMIKHLELVGIPVHSFSEAIEGLEA